MSNLLRLIGRRLLALPIMVLGVTLLVFVVMSFSTADPAVLALGESATPEALERIGKPITSTTRCSHGSGTISSVWPMETSVRPSPV